MSLTDHTRAYGRRTSSERRSVSTSPVYLSSRHTPPIAAHSQSCSVTRMTARTQVRPPNQSEQACCSYILLILTRFPPSSQPNSVQPNGATAPSRIRPRSRQTRFRRRRPSLQIACRPRSNQTSSVRTSRPPTKAAQHRLSHGHRFRRSNKRRTSSIQLHATTSTLLSNRLLSSSSPLTCSWLPCRSSSIEHNGVWKKTLWCWILNHWQ